jgi:response regulator RpfG family c-di-GMP phosphodiesterase
MDTKMPNMTGLELLGHVREKWARDRLPVIMVSGRAEPADIVTGLEAGANDYVVKPIEMDVLRARIQVCLDTKAGIDDLIDAERQRVMLESLGSACHHIGQPMTPVLTTLDSMLRGKQANCERCRQQLRDVRGWAEQVADVLHQLQNVLTYRTVPYACGTHIVDIDTTDDHAA